MPSSAVSVLLTELIDYAGLFPPAALPMAEQVAGLDPAIAANSAQVKTLAIPNPPGMRCIQACMAE